jgi:hypothetical protein
LNLSKQHRFRVLNERKRWSIGVIETKEKLSGIEKKRREIKLSKHRRDQQWKKTT